MPPATSRRRSRSVFEDDDDHRSSEEDSTKRPRRQSDTIAFKEEDDEDGETEAGSGDDDTPARTQRRRPQPNGTVAANAGTAKSDYQPGAIVRVKVKDFVTYEHAEFFPGPNLNMVIGPNGTGKSSLVCAICLGLGYSVKTLGRADKLGEFVKHGKEVATIEIELKKRPSERANHLIRVQITKETNRQTWWLNGKAGTQKDIQSLMKRLRIQIDNLCQFLPQDRVVEFAALTPIQLLHETLRAAAPENMLNWQSELKGYYHDYKKYKELVDSTSETLRGHETRQQGLQADVDRLNERETIKQHIEEMQKARSCAEYTIARDRHKEANKKKKESERRLKDIEKACGPALQAVKLKEQYRAKIEAVLEDRKKTLKRAEAAVDQEVRVIEAYDEKIKNSETESTAETQSFKARKEDISKSRRTLTSLEAMRKQEPASFVAGEWNLKIREKEHFVREIGSEKRELEAELVDIKRQGREVTDQMRTIQQKIEDLDSKEGQKMSLLRSISPEVARGWEWLQDHQSEFEKEIFGPPMLTCSLRDERYSSLIQSMLQRNDFLCFSAQTKNDHTKLSNHFYKEMGISVTIRTCGSAFQSFKPPMSADEARRYGLDGFAIDYLDGPEPVLAMLCAEKFLHVSGVALKDITSDQFNELQNGQKINSWATGQTYFRVIRRREYGPDATTTSTRKISPGRFWTDQPVDSAEKVDVQRKYDERNDQRNELQQQVNEKKSRVQELQEKEVTATEELNGLREEKSNLQKAYTVWTALPNKIANEEETLKNRQEALRACRSRIADLDAKEDDLLIKKAQAVLQQKVAISRVREAHQALLDVQIRLIEAASDVGGLKDRNTEMNNGLAEMKEEIKNYVADAALAKKEATEALKNLQHIITNDPSDMARYTEMVAGKSLDEIDHEIGAEKAKLELIHGVDHSVLRQFQKRAKDIQDLTKRKDEMTMKLDSLDNQIKQLMSKWEPELDALIAKINTAFGHNFDLIGCAGEVGVNKHEDFEQWCIEIKVKFRENEALVQLNQHRQSGGERAVSTVFYLMALQSMAQAPFRVVDEINQGMDPRNERMVHERMVEIACREHTSQYFLITPKLLTGLRYDERMRVLCIASGEFVPEDGDKMDFNKIVPLQLAIKASA